MTQVFNGITRKRYIELKRDEKIKKWGHKIFDVTDDPNPTETNSESKGGGDRKSLMAGCRIVD